MLVLKGKIKTSILILTTFIVMCCEVKQNDEHNVEGESYQKVYLRYLSFSGDTIGHNTAYLEKSVLPKSYSYKYKVDNHKDSSNLYYQIQKTNDSTIYFLDEPCKKIESKKYYAFKEEYTVISYFYDVENSIDEEATMYFNENFGLLLIYSNGWRYLTEIFEYNEVSNILCKAILKDTTNNISLHNEEKIFKLLERK